MANQREHIFGAAAAALLLLAWSSTAATPAERRGPGGPGGHGPGVQMLERAGRALQLTEQQQQQAHQLFESRRAEMDALHAQMRGAHERFEAALEAKSPDVNRVGQIAIEQHRLRQKGQALHEELSKAFQALLTPEQQQKFELLKAMREGDGDGPHRGPFGHGPRPDGPEGDEQR